MAHTTKRTTADGETRYDVRTRIGGRVVTRTFIRRKDATANAATVEADKLRGVVVDPRRAQVTLGEYGTWWLAQRPDLAVRTAELYQWLFERYIGPRFADTTLADISPSAVRSWHAKIARSTPTTAAKAYRLLSSMMRTAVADEVIPRNPCQVKGAAVEKAPERPVASVAEVAALADAMPEHMRLLVLLACWCQLRRGELLGLRRRDIDLMRSTLTIAQSRTFSMTGQALTKSPKTDAGRRTLAIPQNVTDALTSHIDTFVAPEPDALIFVGEKGGPLTTAVLDKAWKRARGSVGRSDLRLHDLCHTGLTFAAATGATVAELKHRAGHESAVAALRYQHATANRDRVLADALADLAAPATVLELRPRDTRAMD